jgi:hypothetical protein
MLTRNATMHHGVRQFKHVAPSNRRLGTPIAMADGLRISRPDRLEPLDPEP